MMADDPNRSRTSSSVVSMAEASERSNGNASWIAESSSRLLRVTPMSVIPRSRIIGIAASSRTLPTARIVSVRAVASQSVCDLVARVKSSNRSRRTTVRQTRWAARSLRASRSTSATRSVSSASGDRGLRPSARCVPIERRRRPTWTRRGSRLWARAWRCRPPARPSIRTSAASPSCATCPTVVIECAAELARRDRPDAPQPFDRKRVEELQLAVGRHQQQTVGLRDTAGHLREELRPRDSHRDRHADLLEDLSSQSDRDLHGRARDPPQSTDVEERLVDRQPLDERRRVVEHLEQRLARLAVGIHPRAHDDRLRAQPERLRSAHRRGDPERLRLVAGRQHHARPHDDGTAAQAGVVSLLDRRVERVDVCVQDRRLARHEHMFASAGDARVRLPSTDPARKRRRRCST